jgi:hypothetical protein
MNPHASYKCASRLLMAATAIVSILLTSGCGGTSSNTPPPNQSGFTTASLTGTYVISVTGTDVNTTTSTPEVVPFALVGTIVSNGTGGISSGTVDISDPGNTGVNIGTAVSSTGSGYQINTDGRGTATLNVSINGTTIPFDFDFVLTSTSGGLISRFDDSGSDIGAGSGTIDLQSPATSLTGSYAFSLSGADTAGNPLGTVGAFTIGTSGITGTEDFNEDGTSGSGFSDLALTGQATLGSSGTSGTAQLATSFATLGIDVWVIDSAHLKFIETDAGGPFLSGDAYTQATALTAGQLVFTLSGTDGSGSPVVAGGYATTDANGNLSNGFEDFNDDGVVTVSKPFSTSSAACVTATGRCQLTLNGFSNGTSQTFVFAVYPSSGGGLALEVDSFGLLQGAVYAQSGTSFTTSGGYGFNLTGENSQGEVDDIAQFDVASTASPAANITGTLDENTLGEPLVSVGLDATYTPDSTPDGRGVITAPTTGTLGNFIGELNLVYYVVNSSTVIFIDVDATTEPEGGQTGVGTFLAQSSTASAAVAHRAVSMVRPVVRPHAAVRRK